MFFSDIFVRGKKNDKFNIHLQKLSGILMLFLHKIHTLMWNDMHASQTPNLIFFRQ